MIQAIDALKSLQIFDGFDEELLQNLATIAECVELREETLIFREGDSATDVFFVLQGAVALEICARGRGCRRILTVGEGELLGWSPVLEQQRLSASARALVPTQAIKLNGRQVLTLCEYNPQFGYEFMKRAALALAKRLNATRLQLLNVYGEEMPRIANENENPDTEPDVNAKGKTSNGNKQEAP